MYGHYALECLRRSIILGEESFCSILKACSSVVLQSITVKVLPWLKHVTMSKHPQRIQPSSGLRTKNGDFNDNFNLTSGLRFNICENAANSELVGLSTAQDSENGAEATIEYGLKIVTPDNNLLRY